MYIKGIGNLYSKTNWNINRYPSSFDEDYKGGKIMNKSDLKTGMLVETRDGEIMRVLKNTSAGDVMVALYGSWTDLNSFGDDFKHKQVSSVDIMKVFSTIYANMLSSYTTSDYKLLWERKENIEMTVAEIEKKLGIENLKIAKEER